MAVRPDAHWPRGCTEDPDVTVCLLEAGPSDVGDDNILVLSEWMHLLDSGYDWDYPVEPQERGNSFMRHARAKVLGGCSSHNSCIAFLPPAECLDEWVTMGADGWSAAEIATARASASPGPSAFVTYRPMIHAAQRFSRPPPTSGCPRWRSTAARPSATARVGSRSTPPKTAHRNSSSHAYLHPILDSRPNLEVRTGCWVAEILFDGRSATGVRYQRPDLTGYDNVSARREVIVTAGAIDTPKLLMLSGIGPSVHLREMGIDVRVDSPGVGSNLDDHVEGLVFWEASGADGDDVDAVVGDRLVHHRRRRLHASRT